MVALQDAVGYVPPHVQMILIEKDDKIRTVVSGYSEDSGMVIVSIDGTADDLELVFHRAAKHIIFKVDPYTAILQQVASHSGDGEYGRVKGWYEEAVRDLPTTPRNDKRAYLENLRGIIALQGNDQDGRPGNR